MAWWRLQSHSGQVRKNTGISAISPTLPEPRASARFARRALLRAAVFETGDQEVLAPRPGIAAFVAAGVITEVGDEAIAVQGEHGIELFGVSPATVTWIGAQASPSALRPGDPVIIRHRTRDATAPGPRQAERIWARIGRVTGTIVEAKGLEFLVATRARDGSPRRVVIARAASGPIQVRFPRLAPGYLLDVIGTRQDDHLLAVAPATAQPPYHAGHSPRPPLVGGPVPMPVSGSAVWHEPGDEPPGLLGLAYPAIDPEGGAPAAGGGAGCVRLPYLSVGAAVRIRNECAERTAVLPVTSDGATAREFCDRCVECGTSPKGRVADLTMAAFVGLGGNLEDGCFNATLATMAGLPSGTGSRGSM
jgi:hypothetical protein